MRGFITIVVAWYILCGAFSSPFGLPNHHNNQDTSIIAILPLDYTFIDCKKCPSFKFTSDDLKLCEDLIKQSIKTYNRKLENKDFSIMQLKKYKRQYFPFINKKGEKIVWVNCFCHDEFGGSYWKKYPLNVMDGGFCYFNVMINLTSKTFDKFIPGSFA